MLRLPKFEVVTPDTIEGVVEALRTPGARIVAGGTDILPNLKHRLDRPEQLVSLTRVRALRSVDVSDGGLRIGASVTLTELSEHQWHTILMEKAVDLPEWGEFEQPGCVPERIGCN